MTNIIINDIFNKHLIMIDSKFGDTETITQQAIFFDLPIDSIGHILSLNISDSEGVTLWEGDIFSFFGTTVAENGSINEHASIVKKRDKALTPFYYIKPHIKEWWDPTKIDNIEEIQEKKLREWYYPLLITTDKVLRHPNHFYRADYWLFCAVKINGKRETRFFPKSNIPDSVWKEAEYHLSYHDFYSKTGLRFGSTIIQS